MERRDCGVVVGLVVGSTYWNQDALFIIVGIVFLCSVKYNEDQCKCSGAMYNAPLPSCEFYAVRGSGAPRVHIKYLISIARSHGSAETRERCT